MGVQGAKAAGGLLKFSCCVAPEPDFDRPAFLQNYLKIEVFPSGGRDAIIGVFAMLEWFLGPRCPRCQKRRPAGRGAVCFDCDAKEDRAARDSAAEVRERNFLHRVAALNVNTICVGDTVSFSFKRGPTPVFNTPPTEPNPTVVAKVLVIDHCLREGDKYGNKVVAINCRDRRYGFFKLQPEGIDRHERKDQTVYCYGTELIQLMQVGPAALREAIPHDTHEFTRPRHWKLRGYADEGDSGSD